MCTVTFIPVNDKVFITSNRDEKLQRKQAIPPKVYRHNNVSFIYPKDADAGGAWIALREDGNAAVLLNGAFQKHVPKPPYKQSRGKIFLEVFAKDMPVQKFSELDLFDIEPFTLIIFYQSNLFECRWDGRKKYCRQLQTSRAYIWSSSTLYDKQVVQKREEWFSQWLQKNPSPLQNDILHFHRFTGDGDKHNDLLMNRDGKMFTVSITGIELNNEKSVMHYLDLKDNASYINKLHIMPEEVAE